MYGLTHLGMMAKVVTNYGSLFMRDGFCQPDDGSSLCARGFAAFKSDSLAYLVMAKGNGSVSQELRHNHEHQTFLFVDIMELCRMMCTSLYNEVGGEYIGFPPSVCLSIRPSVRPASRVCSVAPTVLVGSISYLSILSSNFRRCVTCKVSCKISKFEFLANF